MATLTYAYDPTSQRLKEMTARRGQSLGIVYDLDFDFDGLGRLGAITGPDYTFGTEGTSRSFSYDDLGRLTSLTGPWERDQGDLLPETGSI